MRKVLLSLMAVALMAGSAISQEDDTLRGWTADDVWSYVEDQYTSYVDVTDREDGVTGFFEDADVDLWSNTGDAYTTFEVGGGVLKVIYENNDVKAHYGQFDFTLSEWIGGTGLNFPPAADQPADTLKGMMIDFTVGATVKFEYKLTLDKDVPAAGTARLRMDLIDYNGHSTNSNSAIVNAAEATEWTEEYFAFDDEEYFDFYSGNFWSADNGRYSDNSLLTSEGKIVALSASEKIPVDLTKIVKFSMNIEDGVEYAAIGDKKVTLEMRNLAIGDVDNAVPFKSYATMYGGVGGVGVEETSAVVVSPNPATTTISVEGAAVVTNMLGVVVAKGEGTVDVSALAPGIYNVTVGGASTQVIVQ